MTQGVPQPLPRGRELARRTIIERAADFLDRRTDALTVSARETAHLSRVDDRWTASIGVTVTGHEVPARQWISAAVVLLLDLTIGQFDVAVAAVAEAVRRLPPGTPFAVVGRAAGTGASFPDSGLAVASRPAGEAARQAVAGWRNVPGPKDVEGLLRSARQLLDGRPETLRHAILVGDAADDDAARDRATAELRACRGVFTCDALGVADLAVPGYLYSVSGLGGDVDGSWYPDDLAEMAGTMVTRATRRGTHRETLRIRTPAGVAVRDIGTTDSDSRLGVQWYPREFKFRYVRMPAVSRPEPDGWVHEHDLWIRPGSDSYLQVTIDVEPGLAPAVCQLSAAGLDCDQRPVESSPVTVTLTGHPASGTG
jgi:hypothetical protein